MKYLSLAIALALFFSGTGHAVAGSGAMAKQPMNNEAILAPSPAGSLLTASSQQAADALQSVIAGRLSKESPVLVASMVQLDDLQKSSTLGRMVMQQIASRLSQYGFRIVESRLRQDMAIIPHEGEFMLTRDVAKLMQTQYAAQAVLVGSYVNNPTTVYFSLRLIRLDDGSVVAGYEYHLPNKGEVRNLLRQDKKSTVDVDPVWNAMSRREVAYTANGVALPPVKDFGASRQSLPPVFQGNAFQGGGAAPMLQPQGNIPVLTQPHRMTQSPAPNPDIPQLGPPQRMNDAQTDAHAGAQPPAMVMPDLGGADGAIR